MFNREACSNPNYQIPEMATPLTSCLKDNNNNNNNNNNAARGGLHVRFQNDGSASMSRPENNIDLTTIECAQSNASRRRKLRVNEYGWYQILVPRGHLYCMEEVLGALHTITMPRKFYAHYWHVCKNSIFFFVNDYGIADRLNDAHDTKLRMRDGQMLTGICVRSRNPIVRSLSDCAIKAVMEALRMRYCTPKKFLNLNRFHADSIFGYEFCPLSQESVLQEVLDMVVSMMPNVVEINLSHNNLRSLAPFANLKRDLPKFCKLNLSNNRLQHQQLTYLSKFPLVELHLANNPLSESFTMVKDAHKIFETFPKLKTLDRKWHRHQLPPTPQEPSELMSQSSHELIPQQQTARQSTQSMLPLSIAGALPPINDQNVVSILEQYLVQYFGVFDVPEQRHTLTIFYHEQAMLTINHNESNDVGQVVFGREAIIGIYSNWPKTIHKPCSFKILNTTSTPEMICCMSTGQFSYGRPDLGVDIYEERGFVRNYMIVTQNGKLLIRSELVSIKNFQDNDIQLNQNTTIMDLSNAMENGMNITE